MPRATNPLKELRNYAILCAVCVTLTKCYTHMFIEYKNVEYFYTKLYWKKVKKLKLKNF